MAYSLNELKTLRMETLAEISEIIKRETADGAKTAAELAAATNGLCNVQHLTATICGTFGKGRRSGTYGGRDEQGPEELRIEIKPTTFTKTRHFIELDDNGAVIGRFDKEEYRKVNTYKAEL